MGVCFCGVYSTEAFSLRDFFTNSNRASHNSLLGEQETCVFVGETDHCSPSLKCHLLNRRYVYFLARNSIILPMSTREYILLMSKLGGGKAGIMFFVRVNFCSSESCWNCSLVIVCFTSFNLINCVVSVNGV